MSRVLTHSELEAAVVSLVIKRQPISARRLAREAFVAPATLYGHVSSIDEAIDIGQAAVAREAAPRLAAAIRYGHFTELAFWINRNIGKAGLFFNPCRNGGLSGLDNDLDMARVVVGGVLAYASVESSTELRQRIVDALAHLEDPGFEDYKLGDLPISTDTLIDDVWSETRRLIAESGELVEIRTAAIDLLHHYLSDGWTFRQVAEITGDPLAAIHRHGSRSVQLAKAVSDFAAGLQTVARSWAQDDFEAVSISFALLQAAPGVLDALTEVVWNRLRTGAIALIVFDDAVSSAVQARLGLVLSQNASRPWVSATR